MLAWTIFRMSTTTALAVVVLLVAPPRACGSGAAQRGMTSHVLVGLTPSTAFEVYAAGQAIPGSPAASDELGILTFEIDDSDLPPGSIPVTVAEASELLIVDVFVDGITPTSAVVHWQTNLPSSSLVEYGETPSYGSWSSLDPDPVLDHAVELSGLSAGTTYHFRVLSDDGQGHAAQSADDVFDTPFDALTISGLRVDEVGDTWAVVSWTTNRPADTQVEYGTTSEYGSATVLDPRLVESHVDTLTGLSPGTIYHFRALSNDEHGFAARSDDGQLQTTLEPLEVTDVAVVEVDTTWAVVSWTTNRPADSQVEYGLGETYGSATPVDPALVTEHLVTLDSLLPATSYHFRVRSDDGAGDVAYSGDSTFVTEAPALEIADLSVAALGPTWAIVAWTTNRPATTRVDYGPTPSYGFSVSPAVGFVTEHSATLAGLAEGALYHFRAVSSDSAGAEVTSPDSTFTTFTAGPSGPPTVEDVTVEQVSATAVVVSWMTDREATSRVRYGTGGILDCATTADTLETVDHSVLVWPVVPRILYSFAVVSACGSDTTVVDGFTFETSAPPGNDPEGKGPEVERVFLADVGETTAVVGWVTDRPCSTWVEYGIDDTYGEAAPGLPLGGCAYRATLAGLERGTMYHYRVNTWDPEVGPAVGDDATFVTDGAPDADPPLPPLGVRCELRDGAVLVFWNSNTEPDLVGYFVYRARASGDDVGWSRAVRLTDDPVPDTHFLDFGVEPGESYSYAVTALDEAGNESAFSQSAAVSVPGDEPAVLALSAYPNPVRDSAELAFTVPPGVESASLRIVSTAGRVVREFRGPYGPGDHTVVWDGRDVSGWPAGAGVYLCELTAAPDVVRRKLTLVR